MIITLIAALDQAGGIGKGGKLPWRLSADLQRFKALTLGHFLIVGRKTYQSIGRPLPGRRMIVISRDLGFQPPGCQAALPQPETPKDTAAQSQPEKPGIKAAHSLPAAPGGQGASSIAQAPDCQVAHSLEQALSLAQAAGESEAFIGGGGEIFAQALPLATRFYLTEVHARLECDAFFPPWDAQEWVERYREEHPADDKNHYSTTFRVLERLSNQA